MKRPGISSLNPKPPLRSCLRLWALACGTACMLAGFSRPAAGDTGSAFPFLEISESARPASLAEAYTAVADDGQALYWNPAGLGRLRQQEVSASYLNYLVDIQAGAVQYAGNGFGLGIVYLNYGPIPEDFGTDPPGTAATLSVPYSLALSLGYGRRVFDGFWAGASLKGMQESIGPYTAQGIGADLGLLYLWPGEVPWRVGACVKNLGLQTKAFVEERGRLPLSETLGIALPLWDHALLLSLDGVFSPGRAHAEFSVGAEYDWNNRLQARVGYRSAGQDLNTGGGLDFLNGLSLGAGLSLPGFRLDYAFVPFNALGNTHRVSLVFPWGEERPEPPSAPVKRTPAPRIFAAPAPGAAAQLRPAPSQALASGTSRAASLEKKSLKAKPPKKTKKKKSKKHHRKKPLPETPAPTEPL